MTNPPRSLTPFRPLLAAALAAGVCGAAAAQSPTVPLLDLTPERVEAFRQALKEFTAVPEGYTTTSGAIFMESEYHVPADFFDSEDVFVPYGIQGRDLVAEELLLVDGREDEYERAARHWVERRLKGSDAARQRRGRGTSPYFAWNDGPMAGVRKGPFSVVAGEDRWRIKVSRPLRHVGGDSPWTLRAWCGEDDDGFKAAFTIGRSLLHARTR